MPPPSWHHLPIPPLSPCFLSFHFRYRPSSTPFPSSYFPAPAPSPSLSGTVFFPSIFGTALHPSPSLLLTPRLRHRLLPSLTRPDTVSFSPWHRLLPFRFQHHPSSIPFPSSHSPAPAPSPPLPSTGTVSGRGGDGAGAREWEGDWMPGRGGDGAEAREWEGDRSQRVGRRTMPRKKGEEMGAGRRGEGRCQRGGRRREAAGERRRRDEDRKEGMGGDARKKGGEGGRAMVPKKEGGREGDGDSLGFFFKKIRDALSNPSDINRNSLYFWTSIS